MSSSGFLKGGVNMAERSGFTRQLLPDVSKSSSTPPGEENSATKSGGIGPLFTNNNDSYTLSRGGFAGSTLNFANANGNFSSGKTDVAGFGGSKDGQGTMFKSAVASNPFKGLRSGLFTAPSAGGGSDSQEFRKTEGLVKTEGFMKTDHSVGKQGKPMTSARVYTAETNLFTPLTTPPLKTLASPAETMSSGNHVDLFKANDVTSATGLYHEQPIGEEEDCNGSGINLECSETGSNLDDEHEDGNMDTGSVYSFRGSDVEDEGSSCTMNGSQCSETPGGRHPSTSSSSTPGVAAPSGVPSGVPRRTKNGILLRDRTNRLPVADRVRQKRSAMQDMARPLKHWLYRHRGNPYPSKGEKQQLATQSNMSLTQVSNWFANARRRLKNTVRGSDVTWDTRIQQYNTCVQGNAELLSASSDSGGDSETEVSSATQKQHEQPPTLAAAAPPTPTPVATAAPSTESQSPSGVVAGETDVINRPGHVVVVDAPSRAGLASPVQHKFKQSILHRYLNDSFEHSLQFRSPFENRSRNPSGSVGSHDFEDCSMSMSSRSSPIHEHSFDDVPEDLEQFARQWEAQPKKPEDELYWKEISAALALTTLARSRYSYK